MPANKPPEEMTDEELRIEIAALKEWTHFHDHPLWEWVGPYGLPPGHATGGASICPACNVPNHGCANLPMWTTNIADAWPLVEEIQKSDDDDALRDLSFLVQLAIMKKRNPCRAICELYVKTKREEAGK